MLMGKVKTKRASPDEMRNVVVLIFMSVYFFFWQVCETPIRVVLVKQVAPLKVEQCKLLQQCQSRDPGIRDFCVCQCQRVEVF